MFKEFNVTNDLQSIRPSNQLAPLIANQLVLGAKYGANWYPVFYQPNIWLSLDTVVALLRFSFGRASWQASGALG